MKKLYAILTALMLACAVPAWAAGVNINTADAEALQQALSGVGSVKARAIVDYREKHGPFTHVDDLIRVEGIGLSTLELNRDRLSLK